MSMAALLLVPGSLALLVTIMVLASWLEGLAPRQAEVQPLAVPTGGPRPAEAGLLQPHR